MEREYTENGLQVKAHDDTRTYDIKTKEFNITLSIYSTISEKYSVENGNSISNGSHRVLDVKIAITAHCLAGLVYCCLLECIGVERSRILEWCKDKILR